ncbi:hypothetical protein GN244_ATG04270 [Phytophthora infestans]|uniref:Uncharacterized protein n=1 Tax=Phytophthora infestans TaxID=4787 RepID=A0A833WN94_PHYIN|nr:hypothetical protein GN244_ATG04270 [Phytophthora infestans]KAF4130058.1 hypothetical protein GN958_ATG20717 [Phytophthora infestans]KAF4144961.1 hypothetical protein GN958_ATG05890 [Phytophthora infestans]
MTRSERATILEWLGAVMIANELLGDTDGCDEEAMVYKTVSNNQYLERNHVEKTEKWEAQRRDLRMNKQTFELLLERLRSHPVFLRSPEKQKQAPFQLQLEVLL